MVKSYYYYNIIINGVNLACKWHMKEKKEYFVNMQIKVFQFTSPLTDFTLFFCNFHSNQTGTISKS